MPLPGRRPLLCLVTDRTRLAGGAPVAAVTDRLVEVARGAARGGVDLIQVRERDLPARDLLALVERCLDVTRGTGTRVVVNDRADVALAAGAHGVHLRGDSIDAVRLREIAPPEFIVGRSVHGEVEARDAVTRGGLDYLILGAVFGTRSKSAGYPTLGLEVLARVVREADLPVLAIGGMTLDHLPAIVRSGAAGVAAIGLFLADAGDAPDGAAENAARRARAAVDAAQATARSGKLTDRS